MFAFMLKKVLILVAVVVSVLGIGKVAVAHIEKISPEMAGSVEVKNRSLDNVKDIVEIETIPYKTIVKETSALRSGTQSLAQKGEAGEKTVMYSVVYGKDGKEQSRKIKSERIIKPPINEITVKGTLVP